MDIKGAALLGGLAIIGGGITGIVAGDYARLLQPDAPRESTASGLLALGSLPLTGWAVHQGWGLGSSVGSPGLGRFAAQAGVAGGLLGVAALAGLGGYHLGRNQL